MELTEPVGNNFRRGDIWIVDSGDAPSDPEQGFHRPAVIVSDDRLHHPNLRMLVVVPGTSTIRGLSLHVDAEPGVLKSPKAAEIIDLTETVPQDPSVTADVAAGGVVLLSTSQVRGLMPLRPDARIAEAQLVGRELRFQ